MDPTLGEPEGRHGPLPRSSGTNRVVGSVAEELAAAQGTSQVRWGSGRAGTCRGVAGDAWARSVRGGGCVVQVAPTHGASLLCPPCLFLTFVLHPPLIPVQTVLEGDLVNLGVTSPAAALALGLMYLQVPLWLKNKRGGVACTHFLMPWRFICCSGCLPACLPAAAD